MKKILFLLLINSSFIYSQSPNNLSTFENQIKDNKQAALIEKMMMEADQAYMSNDLQTAQFKYLSVIKKDSLNSNAWFNLGVTHLNLGNREQGCECLLQSYYLKSYTAWPVIKDYCVVKKINGPMNSKDVHEMPKFILNGKEHFLFVNDDLNKILIEYLGIKMYERKSLAEEFEMASIALNINKNGELQCHVRILRAKSKYNHEKIQDYITEIFKSLQYIPAKYQNQSVDLWSGHSIKLHNPN